MPKIPGYTDDAGVPLNTALSEGSGFRLNDSTADLGLQGMKIKQEDLSKVAQLYNRVAIQNQAMVNNIKVSEAKASAIDAMNNVQTNLMNEMGTNVLEQTDLSGNVTRKNLLGRWQDNATAIIQKNRMTLQNDIQRSAYDQAINSVLPEKTDQVFSHQLLQTRSAMEKQNEAVTTALLSGAKSAAQSGNFAGAKSYATMAIDSNNQSYAIQGIPYDAQIQMNQDTIYDFLNGIKKEIPAGNFGPLIDQFKDKLRDDQYKTLKNENETVVAQASAKNDAKSIVSQCINPDGTVNRAKVQQLVEAKKQDHAKSRYEKNYSADAFLGVYSSKESNDNYSAVNTKSGAYGKYQIMPALWQDLMRNNNMPLDTPMTPENQDKYFRPYAQGLLEKYGPEGAFVALYAGEQNAVRWNQGLSTGIGEDGEYSFYAPQGNDPSVAEYVRTRMEALDQEIPNTELIADKGYNDALDKEIALAINEQIDIETQTKNQNVELMTQYVRNNPNATFSDIQNLASQLYPNSMSNQQALISIGQEVRSGERSGNKFDQARDFDNATEYIIENPNATELDLRAKFPNLTGSQVKTLTAAVGKTTAANVKWGNETNLAYLNGVIKQNKLTGIEKANVMNKMNVWTKKYYEENGTAPTDDEIQSQIMDMASKAKIEKNSWLFGTSYDDADYIRADLPAGWTPLTESTAQDQNGNIFEYDEKTHTWVTELK